MTAENNQDPWTEYRNRRRWLRLALLLTLGAVGGGVIWSSTITALLLLVSGGTSLAVVRYVESWPCPRCGRAFFRRGRSHDSFAKRCMNCALPKWMHPDAMPNPEDAPLPNRATWV